MRSIGIDIGRFSIKVAELDYTSKSCKLNQYTEYLLPIDHATDPYVHIIEKLKQILQKYDKDLDKFTVGLAQELVCTRNVSFPFTEKYKIAKSIEFELEDNLPFDTESSIIHPKIIYTKDSSSQVLASAALKDNIQRTLETFQDVGIEPDILSSEGVALSNYFEAWNAPVKQYSAEEELSNKAQAILHIGHSKSILVIERSGHVISIRSILYGGKDLAKEIARKYNVSFTEAMKTVQEKAFLLLSQKEVNQEQITFSNLIAASLDNLSSEVKRHILSIEAENEIKVEEVYISGGLSQIQNMGPHLTQSLQISVNPFYKDLHQMEMLANIKKEQQASSMIALGYALEGARSFKNPAVNFRKEDFVKKSQLFQLFINKWGYTLRATAILFCIFFVYSFAKESITYNTSIQSSGKLKDIAKTYGLKGRQATSSKIRAYVREKQREVNSKEQVEKLQGINSPMDLLLSLSKTVPTKEKLSLDVTNWSLKGDRVHMTGYVSNSSETLGVKKALQDLSSNQKVEIATPTKQKAGKTSFSYSIKVERNIGDL